MLSNLSRWSSLLGSVALLAAIAAPVRAEMVKEFAVKEPLTKAQSAARQDRLDDRQEAADEFNAANPNDLSGSTIRVNGMDVLRFRVASGGYSAVQRYQIVQKRLTIAWAGLEGSSLNHVSVATVNGDPVIYLRGTQLVTVTSADATANGGGTAASLAQTWAANLRQGLDLGSQ